ncbi:MAG: hypothetical protein US68_C0004G0025 [Candidatus Shapirobacteria bacterium GW2011_GWE1_38_10]|uniref:Uncharacterized protein n=1 Tax=Candidatus Shapirobacteria bacterium GW2011_GWE1_38_10 TaxID=1618488 RepID=A0A0G0I5C5_9BACT|nr:MAG: hypothetical protein US46_C0005G0041 [Candidatus Shapirobacteria bacterium GW2011_GWF2_37_20]KKQ50543.1 MAG: hypothetical protein US68_C0004G0025 [Candidatus Shapirobacteria bacterium GW2011_GWE1_38_10]KKQ64685.1 MAG: hypothetical protein US85_C0005G0033 [Candidatus Shapirobacteria bacterium GW2011_GWF1_38_23]
MPISPIKAMVRVEEAVATAFCSPLLRRYLKPPLINIKRKAKPASKTITWRTLKKRHSKPWMVAMSL